jgi:nicotinamidase-related amidase
MRLDRDRCALVLVDYQGRLMPALDCGPRAVQEAVFLGRVAQVLGVPVYGTEQNPARLGPNEDAVRALCAHTLPKMHFDATADGLLALLQSTGRAVNMVVVAGCEAHVCLMQTGLGLLAAGLRVAVVPEACASRRPGDKALGLQRLADAGATLFSAEMLAFEWLRSCEDPQFKNVLAHIKARPV